MKIKTKKIIAVVVAILFSFTIMGAVIVSIISPKYNAVSASADSSSYSASADRSVSHINEYFGGYEFNFDSDYVMNSYNSDTGKWEPIAGVLKFNYITFIGDGQTNYISFTFVDGKITACSASFYSFTELKTKTIYIYRLNAYNEPYRVFIFPMCYSDNLDTKFREILLHHTKPCITTSSYLDIYSYAYEEGYEEGSEEGASRGYDLGYSTGHYDGREEGEQIGYDNGYSVGYEDGLTKDYTDGYVDGLNKGHSDQITNPLSSFLEPVHNFMNTEFFGGFTYATIFNIVLFVAVATIFIKMFSGG